jgi:hypothetical protein
MHEACLTRVSVELADNCKRPPVSALKFVGQHAPVSDLVTQRLNADGSKRPPGFAQLNPRRRLKGGEDQPLWAGVKAGGKDGKLRVNRENV